MGSTRLPGKVMMLLAGKTVLFHVISRCLKIKNADVVCCAIPIGRDSDLIAAEATRCGAVVFRGSELDVLDRYHQAAIYMKSDYILRITSDCPLIDPGICEVVIDLLKSGNCEFSTNNLPRSWPHGLDCEAFPYDLLAEAASKATNPYHREHVTPWMRENNPHVKIKNHSSPDIGLSNHRWTLDTDEDYEFLKCLFNRMPIEKQVFSYKVPLNIVTNNPSLVNLSTD